MKSFTTEAQRKDEKTLLFQNRNSVLRLVRTLCLGVSVVKFFFSG